MDENKLRKQVKAGNDAQSMISGGPFEPLAFNDAVDALHAELMKAWKESKSAETRDRVWVSVHLLEKLKDHLGTIAANGRVAQGDLDRLLKK